MQRATVEPAPCRSRVRYSAARPLHHYSICMPCILTLPHFKVLSMKFRQNLRTRNMFYGTCICPMHHACWCLSSRSLKLHFKYFKNGDRYDVGVNRSRIESHPCAVDWHHHLCPWMTLNCPKSRSQNFHVKYLECLTVHQHIKGHSVLYLEYREK